ncbi:CPBP family intramembrane glutamic endopeptidase [Bacillus cereus]|uniref:CAAX prenyl protease 2/Lysostaphin resistance protein A-like domain-containing protein n=1 Tax=Bacillus cereus HuA2-1 TaxID=1053201 RepID=J9C8P5_BACCE|nr:type II CAAX endopeptidase family protein [Bacillus cereus]EJV87816.1 hypothetical protein IG3_01303 [Bacillus cereus HuA2-1]
MENITNNKPFMKTIGKISILFVASFLIINLSNLGIHFIVQKVYSIFNDVSQMSPKQLSLITIQNPIFLAACSLSNIMFLVFLFVFTKKIDKESLKDIIFRTSSSSKKHTTMFMYGLVIALLTIIVFLIFGTGIGVLNYAKDASMDGIDGNLVAFLISGILFSFITGFYEEIFFRGYILNQLLKWNRKYALVISSFIFMLSEMPTTFKPVDLMGIFLTGIFFGYLYMTTSSLFITAGIHSMLHFILLNIITFEKYDYGLPTLFTFNSHGDFTIWGMEIATSTGVCTFFVNALSIVILYAFNQFSHRKLEKYAAR